MIPTTTALPPTIPNTLIDLYDPCSRGNSQNTVLDDTGKTAFQKHLNSGGNFVGIHSASGTLNTTVFYGKGLGAGLDTSSRSEIQNTTIVVLDASHPSTENLPTDWPVRDEIPQVCGCHPVDESNYTGVDASLERGVSIEASLILLVKIKSWYQEHGAGVDELFMNHIPGGIQWTLQANTTRAFNSSALVGNGGHSSSASAFASPASTLSTSGIVSALSSAAVHFAETSSIIFAAVVGVVISVAAFLTSICVF
ncbi:hypothetical protein ARMGADRAFT_1157831 [Armillaria gallica]|uniref:ThuA-like domain-containing protein n=1 Tax=Armillaria gallica TaxID=47427 RepID=A0A2H3E8L5_ARMGA|nr:hypothetical protein ARMGADRAFT_1157831 [Armillaria gallica]